MVNDEDLLPPQLAQFIGNKPQSHVRRASGSQILDDLNYLFGVIPGLGPGAGHDRHRQQPYHKAVTSSFHIPLPRSVHRVLMSAASMIGHHLSVSALWNAASATGV